MTTLLLHGAVAGVTLSAAMFTLILIVLRVNPEIMLNDYPPDVRAAYGPISRRGRRQRALFALLFFALLALAAKLAARDLAAILPHFTFRDAFVYAFTMTSVLNLLDWLVLDNALVFFQPRFVVLPGTEGMAGYRDYRFHVRGFVVGVPLAAVAGVAIAAVMVVMRV